MKESAAQFDPPFTPKALTEYELLKYEGRELLLQQFKPPLKPHSSVRVLGTFTGSTFALTSFYIEPSIPSPLASIGNY